MNDFSFSDGLASGLDDSPSTFESKSSSIVLIFCAILESSSQLAAENVLNFFSFRESLEKTLFSKSFVGCTASRTSFFTS